MKLFSEAAIRGVALKKMFLKLSENSQRSTCVSFLNSYRPQAEQYRTPLDECFFIFEKTVRNLFKTKNDVNRIKNIKKLRRYDTKKNLSSHLRSQNFPLNPGEHSHIIPCAVSVHTPLLLHGLGLQWSITMKKQILSSRSLNFSHQQKIICNTEYLKIHWYSSLDFCFPAKAVWYFRL